jgi:AcrR family transcriptional regulator
MPPKENTTKRRIVAIALDLIKKNGYDQVTLNDICSAAGISKHTFYYYFESKEHILLEFYRIPREIGADMLTSILTAENYYEQFWMLMEPGLDFFIDAGTEIVRRVLIANITRDMGTFSFSKHKSDLGQAQVAILKKAQECKEIGNRSDPSMLLHSTLMLAIAIITTWCISNGAFDLKNAVRSGIEVCLDVEPSLRKSGCANKL